ncbi:MAG: TetR/AcrR family transcriptional regulator [Candidatus Marinimicrobia bacterium]|nr:TetR/AcrR family transcriptional regulator [Candidatus Neomarinimicrobiota bacterium]
MPKIIVKDEVKIKIAKSAFKVFTKKGYEETRMKDIADYCNISRTSIYQYFNNKDEIFFFILHTHLDDIYHLYRKTLRMKNMDELEKIQRIIEDIFNQYYNKEKVLELYATYWLKEKLEHPGVYSDLQQRTEKLKDVFEALLAKGIQRNVIKELDVSSMANILFLIVRGFIMQSSVYTNVSPSQLIVSTKFLLQGLRKLKK